jgi:hypothetical protein
LFPKRFGNAKQGCGMVSKRFGSVKQGCGMVSKRFGSVKQGCGMVSKRFGSVKQGCGTVSKRFGRAKRGCGTVSTNVGCARKGALRFGTFINLTAKVKHIKKYSTEDAVVSYNCKTVGRIRGRNKNKRNTKSGVYKAKTVELKGYEKRLKHK